MNDVLNTELGQIRKDYLQTEQLQRDERKCLLKIIHTISFVMTMHAALIDEFREEGDFPDDIIQRADINMYESKKKKH